MTFGATMWALVAVTLGASAVQGLAGFGFGLFAATGYLWLLGPADAVPLVMLVNFSMSGFLAFRARADVDRVLNELNSSPTVAGTDDAKSYRILFDAFSQRRPVSLALLRCRRLLLRNRPHRKRPFAPDHLEQHHRQAE